LSRFSAHAQALCNTPDHLGHLPLNYLIESAGDEPELSQYILSCTDLSPFKDEAIQAIQARQEAETLARLEEARKERAKIDERLKMISLKEVKLRFNKKEFQQELKRK
jgi:hypothetical protein